jgi:hypothetical protein
MRTFVLEPACEIAASWIEPVTGRTIESLTHSLLRLRNKTSNATSALHFLVLSESLERNRQIAAALRETAEGPSMIEPDKLHATHATPEDRFVVSWGSHCQVTLQAVTRMSRPTSKAQIDQLRSQLDQQIEACNRTDPLNLLVFAGASPDPSLIHWEDYCRGWAELLGLVQACEFNAELPAFRKLPKYLLSADDPRWAAHELQAAMTAMTCPIQPCGAFFDA